MITIFVGDVTEYLSHEAKKYSFDAQLITQQHPKKLASGTYYISLGDFQTPPEFAQFLVQADAIVYRPPETWTDRNLEEKTRFYVLSFKHKLINSPDVHLPALESAAMLNMADIRRSDAAQLWVAGCSVTHGVGVKPYERYGKLIADELELPVSFLTWPGSSVEWSADQILRSDIRSGDTVVWGITSLERYAYYKDRHVNHVTVHYYERNPGFDTVSLDELTSDNRIYQALTSMHRVINFCNKLNVNLLIIGILAAEKHFPYLLNVPGYLNLNGMMPQMLPRKACLDIGDDGRHPGPITHKWYAEQILKKLNSDR